MAFKTHLARLRLQNFLLKTVLDLGLKAYFFEVSYLFSIISPVRGRQVHKKGFTKKTS